MTNKKAAEATQEQATESGVQQTAEQKRVIEEIMECMKESGVAAEINEDGIIETETEGIPFFIEVGREDEMMPLYVMVSTMASLNDEAEELDMLRVTNEMNHTFATGKMRIYDYEVEGGATHWNAQLLVSENESTIEDFADFFTAAFNTVRIMLLTLASSHTEILGKQEEQETATDGK